jgi:predicted ATPase/class 3 adenylate cyclase
MTWFTGSTCYGGYDGIFVVTIQCVECNHENRDEASFCTACGTSLACRCPACGAIPQVQASFCDACGASLKNTATPAAQDPPPTADDSTGRADAERRHLTVVFCDLVGSSKLSELLDPEEFRDLLATYQDSCAAVVSKYDGHVARYVGDGLLIYFGYPQAHEDDASRALRSALEVVETVSQLEIPTALPIDALAVRVGIATGIVVVGDIGSGARRDEMAVVGETPNLAARLQTQANPGEIIIAEQTFELVEGYFDIDDLGEHNLKGISQPQTAYLVRAESGAYGRLEASASQGLTPLVGRKEEIAILTNRWAQAIQGELHLVTLSGEAGIGKSRVLRTFRENIADQPHSQVLYYGSAYHQNSAFYPVIDQLERALRIETNDSVELRLQKLQAEVSRLGLAVEATVTPLTSLLSLDKGDQDSGRLQSGDLKRLQQIAICNMIEAMSTEVPVLMVLEDAHWFDASTLELLAAISERLNHARLLVVMTHRPEFTFTSRSGENLTQIPLSHLGGFESTAIVTKVAGNKPLPDEVVAELIAKTDGIPLFVEELTKSLLESGVLRDDGKRFVLDNPLPPLAIPPSLQDSLMARLDRLATTKDIAQLAACIGRSFDFRLLSAVTSQDEGELRSALDQLVDTGLIHERGMDEDINYEFKHALVRDAAYDSLLKTTRQLNHQRIANALEQGFNSLIDAQPGLLALHYTEAGLVEQAVIWWQRAGVRSARLAANLEAIQNLERGLKLLATLDQSKQVASREVDMLQVLGNAIRVIEGSASERAEQAYSRAQSLCEWLGDKEREFPVLWGMWSVAMARGAIDQAAQEAQHILALAEEMGNSNLELEAHHSLWGTFSLSGDLAATRHHAERGLELYQFEQHGDFGFVYGNHDPGVCASYTKAMVLWLQGYSVQARRQLETSLDMIRRHTHPTFLAHGLMHCCPLFMVLGDQDGAVEIVEQTLGQVKQSADDEKSAYCKFVLGWAQAAQGDYVNGILLMKEGLDERPPGAFQYYYSHCLSMLADACFRDARIEQGMHHLHQALEEVNLSSEQWWEAELHRLEGHAQLLSDDRDLDRARKSFQAALQVARTQGAKMLELRAATDLARLLQDQSARQEALDLLTPVYEWFTEGFESADLRDAKILIDELL